MTHSSALLVCLLRTQAQPCAAASGEDQLFSAQQHLSDLAGESHTKGLDRAHPSVNIKSLLRSYCVPDTTQAKACRGDERNTVPPSWPPGGRVGGGRTNTQVTT